MCMGTSPPGSQAGDERGEGAVYLKGVAVHPTLLFIAAFALHVTLHEAAHATASHISHSLNSWFTISFVAHASYTGSLVAFGRFVVLNRPMF